MPSVAAPQMETCTAKVKSKNITLKSLLKKVTLETDTILACPLAGARAELAAHSLVPIAVAGLPTLGSDLGVVALKGRSFSPLARYAVDLLKLGQ